MAKPVSWMPLHVQFAHSPVQVDAPCSWVQETHSGPNYMCVHVYIYIDRERDYDYINYICFFLAVWPREPMNFRCLWTGKVRCQAGEVREFSVLAMRNNKDSQLLRQPICHDKTEENFYRARQHFETGSSTMARNPEILGRRAGHRLFMPLQL